MISTSKFNYIILCFFLFFSCTKSYQNRINKKQVNSGEDVFINAHKTLIKNEEEKIDSLLKLSQISFIKDNSGIRIYVEDHINQNKIRYPKDGDNVLVAYHCVVFDQPDIVLNNLLIDTILFKIGYSKQMKGLNYAIKLLKVGDNAKIIIPSHLGFGMSGYGKSVPPYSTLLLNVKLLKIKE